jgi:hypothetical protein
MGAGATTSGSAFVLTRIVVAPSADEAIWITQGLAKFTMKDMEYLDKKRAVGSLLFKLHLKTEDK